MKININNIGHINIVNGRSINEGCYSLEAKKINETKCVGAEGVSIIEVDSGLADVIIAVGNNPYVEVHYYGEVYTDGKLEFDVSTDDDEINVSAKINGSTFNGRLKLNVLIPQKVFRLISVKCQNGSIELYKNVKAKQIKIDLQHGNIKSEASFKEIIAESTNGNTYISIDAESDIEIFISSMNGDVDVELKNIGFCNIMASSMNGFTRNRHNSTGKHKATGDVSSMNGNVRIQ